MKKRFQKSLVVSVILHILIAILLVYFHGEHLPSQTKPLEITLVEPDQLKPHANINKSQQQIVDQNEKSFNEEIPDKAKFLSRNNQKVVEETKAENHGQFNNKAAQGEVQKGPATNSQKKGSTAVAQKPFEKHQKESVPWEALKTKSGLPTLEALKPKFDWNKVQGQNDRKPSAENPGQQSATDDYLKNIKTGAQTVLNTREFVYFSYYNRIKHQIEQYWEPKIKDKVVKLMREGREVASSQDRITHLRITLDRTGTLIGVAVLGESGLHELDDAAVEAFRAAAPFPNPPNGIAEADGTIHIEWSFVLESFNVPSPGSRRAGRGPAFE